MAVTANLAIANIPISYAIEIGTGSASGTINPGDWLAYSGQSVVATNASHTAYWKASAAGVALEASPLFDWAGRSIPNSAIRFMRQGVLRVTAAFSGNAALGVGCYPVTTGSGVASPTGFTGVGATWQTGAKQTVSGGTGVGGSGVAILAGISQRGAVAGTGQMEIVLIAPRPDYY